MTLGVHCLAFQEMLREGFTCLNISSRLQLPSFCWLFVFLLALTQKTQGANTTPVSHVFICTFFSEPKNVDCKKPPKALCSQRGSSTRVFGVCVCMRARVCAQATLQLQTHCWISPESRKSLYKRHAGIMLPVICLTSVFLPESPCPAVCHAGWENNLFWAGRAPAWQEQRGQAQGKKKAREFSDVGSACLMPPPELVLNLSFLYLTLGKLLSADTVRHKITPNMGILLGDSSSLETSLSNSRFSC